MSANKKQEEKVVTAQRVNEGEKKSKPNRNKKKKGK